MQWFRFYHEFANDPKVQRMSEAMQRRLVMLMCLRSCNGDETLHDDDVAFQLRVSPEEWAETKGVFIEKDFIDSDNNLLSWDKRQYRSDSSTERVREHREKVKRSKKQKRNVTVTPPDTDTDTDTDTDSDTSYHSSACEGGFDYFWKVYPRKKAKAHALKAWRQAVKKTSPQEIIFAAEQYRDRTKGAEARYIKHPATWLNGECWHDEPDPDPSDSAEFERRAAILAGLGLAGPGGLDAGPGGSENCHDGAIECGTERGNGSLEADRQAGPGGVAGSVIQFRGGVQPEGQPEGSDADLRPSLSILPGGPSREGGERDAAKLEGLGQTTDASGDVGICFTGTDSAAADGKQDTASHSTQAPGATGTHADRPEGAGCVDGQASQAFPDLPAFLDRRARA